MTIKRARELRWNATDAEQVMWRLLRAGALAGYRFRRQHPVGRYILDFACAPERLAIEIDGGQHAINADADAKRDADLRAIGWRVLRFWNHDVLASPETVAASILEALTPPSPNPLSPPVGREGFGPFRRTAVIGAGAWGTALANVCRRAGLDVVLWARESEVVQSIVAHGVNELFLPGVPVDPKVRVTGDLATAATADLILMVVPTQHLRAVAAGLAPHLAPAVPVIDCAKGIEIATGLFPSEILAEALPGHPIAALSGPTFAAEVARGLPTAITLAAPDLELARKLAQAIGLPTFRPYASDDLPGVEVGGAIKNVLAIACGIVEGKRLGENARAALITRGLAEIVRLGRAKGGRTETAMGLAGLGDLVLTCSSTASRNYSLGKAIGQGESLASIQAQRRSIAEGVPTAAALAALAGRLGIELPIAAAVNPILHQGAEIDATIAALLARPFRDEAET